MRIEGVRLELVKLIFQFVNRGPWVAKGDKLERAIKITFDDILKPAVVATWTSGLPYRGLIFDIPEPQIDIISTYRSLQWVHAGVSWFTKGYSTDSKDEVDYANEEVDDDSDKEYDIIKVNGHPFFLISPF